MKKQFLMIAAWVLVSAGAASADYLFTGAGGYCIGAANGTEGARVVFEPCNGNTFQNFSFRDGSSAVRGRHTKLMLHGKCLTATSLDRYDTPVVLESCDPEHPRQEFVRRGNLIALKSAKNPRGLCLDFDMGNRTLEMHECHGSPWQQWYSSPGVSRVSSLSSLAGRKVVIGNVPRVMTVSVVSGGIRLIGADGTTLMVRPNNIIVDNAGNLVGNAGSTVLRLSTPSLVAAGGLN